MRHVAAGMLALASFGCTTPTSSDSTISLDNFALDPATPPGESIDRELWIVSDAATTGMTLTMRIDDLPPLGPGSPSAFVSVVSGSGQTIQSISTVGTITTQSIPGNVARVRLTTTGGPIRPRVRFSSMTVTRTTAPSHPVEAEQLADRVGAVPVVADQTVDLALPNDERHIYFSFRAPQDGIFEVAYFGPGEMRLAPGDEFPTHEGQIEQRVPVADSNVRFTRVRLNEGNVLKFSVTNGTAGVGGHGRVVVMSTGPLQRLAFPSQTPLNFIATPIGVDHDSGSGSRGPNGGLFDCHDFEGRSALVTVPPPDRPVAGIPPCYRGHEGTDWSLVAGPAGQALQVKANAAASGIVLAVDASHFDECFADPLSRGEIRCINGFLSTTGPIDNFIAVRQDDGLIAHYVHGATGGADVVAGQRVACGEMLTVVASAGNSAGPHLHFELQQLPDSAFNPSPTFTDIALITPSGAGTIPIRRAADWVDPFGPVNRWRELGPNKVPLARCR